MKRTILQQGLFIGGWTIATVMCVVVGVAAYNVGYLEGLQAGCPSCADASTGDYWRSVGNTFRATFHPNG